MNTIRTDQRLAARFGILILLVLGAAVFSGCGAADPYEIPESPFTEVGRVALPSDIEGVAALGDYAYVAGGQAGLHVIDITVPGAPVLISTINTTKYAESVETVRTFVDGVLVDLALVVEGTEGITTYNITDPLNVVPFNQGTTAVDGQRIFVEEPDDPNDPYIVYLAESWKGVRIFESDTSRPGLLEYHGVFSGTQGYAMGIAVRDGWAYIADDEMGLAVLDVRSRILGEVELVSWADTPGNARDVALDGDYAFVADGVEGLAVFEIHEDATPVKVAQIDLPAFSRAIDVAEGWVFLASDDGGVQVVDVSDPTNPAFAGVLRTGGAADVAVSANGVVMVADRDRGFIVLGGPSLERDLTAPAPVATLSGVPYDFTTVDLTWQATGDDGLYGIASSYEMRYAATVIISEADWDAATVIDAASLPVPVAMGTAQTLRVSGLDVGVAQWFSIRATDDEGHVSELGAAAEVSTYSGSVWRESGVDTPTNFNTHSFKFDLVWLDEDGDDPAISNVIIDGTPHAMSLVEGVPLTGALYSYETVLELGDHDFQFHFEDASGLGFTSPLDEDLFVTSRITFTMGSSSDEVGHAENEVLHDVALSDSVAAWPTEVTQAMWTDVGLVNNSVHTGSDLPVHNVTWFEAVEFCNLKSVADGMTPCYDINGLSVAWNHDADGWRLPTEAEWEWLCRAGSTGSTPAGNIDATDCSDDAVLDAQAWYCANASSPQPVSQKDTNAWGLNDMLGNVREWCWDWSSDLEPGNVLDPVGPESGDRRVVRGGSWHYHARECRSAARGAYYPTSADDFVGFRVVRTIRES